MSTSQLRTLKIGEIIILFTKRHPINEPLVIIGNKIVCHTVLNDTALQLTQDPQRIQDTEELRMTIHEDETYAAQEQHHQEEEMMAEIPHQEYHANPIKEALSDLKVTVTFELSRMEMSTNAVSQLREGGIINLQKQITEDVYLTIAGRTIAIGEVVQVGRNFGVLIKEVL
jgi:flagellar motor switch/type III secretory pathway protein FliN